MAGLPDDTLEMWRESIRAMTAQELIEEFQLARQLSSTSPPEEGLQIAMNNVSVTYTQKDYKSGEFFQILTLLRVEMNKRGIKIPGAGR